jgi:cytochrome c oxidase subunit III
MSDFVLDSQRKKIHPYKFNLWVAMAAMLMMFAGFTSALIIKRNQAKWESFDLPNVFWVSTILMVISSVCITLAVRSFKNRQLSKYKNLLGLTTILGVAFIVLQIVGFNQLFNSGITHNSNVAHSFLWVIVGMHALHVLGGVIALIIMFLKIFKTKTRSYNVVPIEVMSTYWHFVDGLWIYLLLFLVWIK